jgi:hypothetical protein
MVTGGESYNGILYGSYDNIDPRYPVIKFLFLLIILNCIELYVKNKLIG